MFDVRQSVRYANQPALDIYNSRMRPLVDEMMAGFQESTEHMALLPRFQLYIDEEEGRLRRALEIVDYDLDAFDTLALVNGRCGIEKVSPAGLLRHIHAHCAALESLSAHLPPPLPSLREGPGGSSHYPPSGGALGCTRLSLSRQRCFPHALQRTYW